MHPPGVQYVQPVTPHRKRTPRHHIADIPVSVTFIPSFIFARVSYHGHFREHGHYRGQKYALQQKTLALHSAEPSV
ncbi:hypothetical protein EA559_23125 [Salmonella enterica subsp. enterica serovar Poona]|nr:hypothetical protein [Salmonella enterica subsp. enterica serovar Poona]